VCLWQHLPGGHCGKHYHYEQDKFCGKIFLGPCGAKNPGIITSQKFKSTNCSTPLFIEKRGELPAGQKAYASSGSRSNCSAMMYVASSPPSLAASPNPLTGPYTAGSREMLGSRLRKHMSTWSATAYARARPSSRQLPTASSNWNIFLSAESRSGSMTPASGTTSPPRIGLKPKDARAASA
jgi:hypothetical protein